MNTPLAVSEMPLSAVKTESARNIRTALFDAAKCATIEGAAAVLNTHLPRYFVYRGGHHVALHRHSGNPERLGLIVEAAQQPA